MSGAGAPTAGGGGLTAAGTGQLCGWSGAGGEPLAWEQARQVLDALAPSAVALWSDLDGLRCGPLPQRLPQTSRVWLWTPPTTGDGGDLTAGGAVGAAGAGAGGLRWWRVVPLQRPDAGAAARLACLHLPGTAPSTRPAPHPAPLPAGVAQHTRPVQLRWLPETPLRGSAAEQLSASGATEIQLVEAVLAVPLRFLALR